MKLIKRLLQIGVLGLSLLNYSLRAEQFDESDFQEKLRSNKPVVSQFFNSTDRDSNFFVPKYERFKKENSDIYKFLETDIVKRHKPDAKEFIRTRSAFKEIVTTYGFRAEPTTMLFKDGKRIDVFEGAPDPAYIQERFQNALKAYDIAKKQEKNPRPLPKQIPKKVVIVPDLETFVYEISRWDLSSEDNQKNIWPVFVRDASHLDKFLEAYEEKEIVKMSAKKIGELDQETIYRALYASWGRETLEDLIDKRITKKDIRRRLMDLGISPVGIILTNLKDKEFSGGFALAAARGQLLDFYDAPNKYTDKTDVTTMSRYKNPSLITKQQAEKIKGDVGAIIKSWDVKYKGFEYGLPKDNLDYITLALNMAYVYKGKEVREGRRNLWDDRFSLDQLINRGDDGNVYAYCGRLAAGHANYKAMCSLFLQPKDSLFFFTKKAVEKHYSLKEANDSFSKFMGSTSVDIPYSTIQNWRKTVGQENRFGLVYVESRCGPSRWSTFDKGIYDSSEMPKNSVPSVVMFNASYPTFNVYDPGTVGGRWMSSGAYILVGPAIEGYVENSINGICFANSVLNGFPIGQIMQDRRIAINSFKHAGNDSDRDKTKPWRLMHLGNPLYSIFMPYQSENSRIRRMNFEEK